MPGQDDELLIAPPCHDRLEVRRRCSRDSLHDHAQAGPQRTNSSSFISLFKKSGGRLDPALDGDQSNPSTGHCVASPPTSGYLVVPNRLPGSDRHERSFSVCGWCEHYREPLDICPDLSRRALDPFALHPGAGDHRGDLPARRRRAHLQHRPVPAHRLRRRRNRRRSTAACPSRSPGRSRRC